MFRKLILIIVLVVLAFTAACNNDVVDTAVPTEEVRNLPAVPNPRIELPEGCYGKVEGLAAPVYLCSHRTTLVINKDQCGIVATTFSSLTIHFEPTDGSTPGQTTKMNGDSICAGTQNGGDSLSFQIWVDQP